MTRSWLLSLLAGLAILRQCSSSSLCDSSVERGIISTSSGTVLVDTSLPVDPVCIRCGYQDQLYTDPAIVTYYYNGAVIVNDTVGGVWVTDEGLIIQDPAVYFDDSDQINCSFVPPDDMEDFNIIEIYFFASAKVLSFTPDNSTVVVGSTLTLNCTFEGDPLPSVLWSHNKTILNVLSDPNLSKTLLMESYALLDVTFTDINDTGVYMCLVNNNFSFDQSDPSVFIVQVAPSPVTEFRNISITHECVSLSWVYGFDGNAPLSHVNILYSTVDNFNFLIPQTVLTSTINPDQTSDMISNLEPLTIYHFSIHVQNTVGVSVPVTLLTQTLSLEPNAPTLIAVETISSEQLQVQWNATIDIYTQSPIIGYEINYNILNESVMTMNVTNGSATSHVLSGLEQGTVYEITVVAINSAGSSPESNSIQQRTNDNLFNATFIGGVAGFVVFVAVIVLITAVISGFIARSRKRRRKYNVCQERSNSDATTVDLTESCHEENPLPFISKEYDKDTVIIESTTLNEPPEAMDNNSIDTDSYNNRQVSHAGENHEKPITDPPPPTDNSSSDTGSSDSHSGSSSHVYKKTNILREGQYRTIAFDQKGIFYHSEDHGVTVIIPENAVKGPATIQFTASRLWPNFKCAKGSYEPVSPFVYICTDDELYEPAQVHIPHYIDGDDKENIVVLVKGHGENGVFEVPENAKFEVHQTTACVEMKHFCVLCLAAAARKGIPKIRRYQVLSAVKSSQHTNEVQICILYSKACFQRTRKHFKEKGYTIKTSKEKEGNICQEGIGISDVQIPDGGRWTWTEIGTINEKITEKDIDMFKFLNCTPETVTDEDEKTLEDYEDEGLYPPRFHLRFENTTRETTDKSCTVIITLTGFVPDSDSDPAADSFSHNISIATVLGETFSNRGENINNDSEEKDPFLIELMPYIEPILYDDLQTYYQFGTQLGLTIDLLTQLDSKFPDKEKCIMQMLLKWRDSSQSVSHHDISKALCASGYPILSVILENQFSIKKDMEAAAPRRQYGGFAVITDSKPLNGCQIIVEKFKQLPQGHIILQQQPSDAELNRNVIPHIASKWRLFARQVGLSGAVLDTIQGDNVGQSKTCFNKVIDQWKNKDSSLYPFTWETVLSVIYSETVRGYKAGEELYQYLMKTHLRNAGINLDPNDLGDFIVVPK